MPSDDAPSFGQEPTTSSWDDQLEPIVAEVSSVAQVASIAAESRPAQSQRPAQEVDGFIPMLPESLDETGLTSQDLEPLIVKQLLLWGTRSGRVIAKHLRLPFSIIEPSLDRLRHRRLIVYCGSGTAGDYQYELSPDGRIFANESNKTCTYCGAAPVGLAEYRHSVARQSLNNCTPTMQGLKSAYADMTMTDSAIGQIGQAITSGRGLFLYGAPGNGKSSIAERAMGAHSDAIWIPRSLSVAGRIVRVYDVHSHHELPVPTGTIYDQRWIRIRRPTVIVGGELNEQHLEVTLNPQTGVCEAPVQLKSNCGCLVIDDFGRQRISVADLLNRWIIPLERQYDILRMPNGSNVEVPFDQLLVFATNLQPSDLCDEAFLRRIPYKIEVYDPTPEQFKELFLSRAGKLGYDCEPKVVEELLDRHFRRVNRPLRYCYVEALLSQIDDFCRFHRQAKVIDARRLDLAVMNFFGRGRSAAASSIARVTG